jgi:MFS transporter, AAHS family, 4-hydroxybenzoate transporter
MGVGRVGSIVGPTIGGVLVGATTDWAALFQIAAIPCAVAATAIGAGYLAMSRRVQPQVDVAVEATRLSQ